MFLQTHVLVRQAALEMLNSDSDDDFDLVKQPAAKRVCTPRPNYWNPLWGSMSKDGYVAGQDDQVETQIQAEV